MSLKNILSDKRSIILKQWCELTVGTYPSDSQRFIRKEKDQFANPVGNIIAHELEALFDELIKDGDNDKIMSCLENIIRIRAVQDFKPSQAIGFVLQLKGLIRGALGPKAPLNGLSDEFQLFENRIDEIGLLAFDIYSQCRQKIYEIRVNEVKNHLGKLLKRANLTFEIPEQEPDL
ncbi:MAG: RsbRD N-terminal domain-containing protein [Desulfobacteraceae bacterium]|nr:MAG: RsbRD N-terminal domain-containing protein [Desulfobacteraceae bacterium]